MLAEDILVPLFTLCLCSIASKAAVQNISSGLWLRKCVACPCICRAMEGAAVRHKKTPACGGGFSQPYNLNSWQLGFVSGFLVLGHLIKVQVAIDIGRHAVDVLRVFHVL